MADIQLIAELLDGAARVGVSISPLAERQRLTLADAYAIQAQVVGRRIVRGEAICGLKMGFTSEAMRRQMGVREPNIGWLTTDMKARDGRLSARAFIHPRVEPEVAILLGRDPVWPSGADELRACVAAVAPALEVVDSRFHDYRFHWLDNIADNSSSAAYALGSWSDGGGDVGGLPARLTIDGALVEQGDTAAALGHPLNALAEGARIAAGLGLTLKAGMVVLTGGVTSAHPIRAGQIVEADFAGLGCVSLDVG